MRYSSEGRGIHRQTGRHGSPPAGVLLGEGESIACPGTCAKQQSQGLDQGMARVFAGLLHDGGAALGAHLRHLGGTGKNPLGGGRIRHLPDPTVHPQTKNPQTENL